MGAIAVAGVDELAQDRAQVTLADGYHVIQAFAAGSPDPALRDRVGARCLNRGPQSLEAEP